MKLSELVKGTGAVCPAVYENLEIQGIAYDSRKVQKGYAFVCIDGFKTDGHDYAEGAVKQGAVVLFTERALDITDVPQIVSNDNRMMLSRLSSNFFGDPTRDLTVFGVTGTNGKTTISFLIQKILEMSGTQCGLLGTIRYSFGNKVYESSNTTPESFELQRLFAEMKQDGAQACSMEVSSHALALSRVSDVKFDYAIFTNLTPDHMDFHVDFENYYAAKKKLFYLCAKCSAVNMDDDYGMRLLSELKADGKNVRSFSIKSSDADYYGKILNMSARGSSIEFYKNKTMLGKMTINTPGLFSVSNALAAAAICLEAGIQWENISTGVLETKGVPGRFETVENDKNIDIIIDYAHTPDALVNVLNTARGFTKGRLITVFGCGGDRDRTKRPIMGKAAAELSDICIVTSDNPRTEDPDSIIAEVVEGVVQWEECNYQVEADRHKAIQAAVDMYREGDVIVIAGKGHEDYQILGTQKHHFDDREEAYHAIERRYSR